MAMQRLTRLAGALSTALALAACDSGTSPPFPPSLVVMPDEVSLQVGEERTLTAVYTDPGSAGAGTPPITWVSLDPAVATVSAAGAVRGVKPGTVGIVATANGAADTARVTVVRTPGRVAITPPPASLAPGDTLRLQATVFDTEGEAMAGQTVQWSVSDTTVATISADGLLTAKKAGTVQVTARAGPASSTVTVTVRARTSAATCTTGLVLALGEVRALSAAEIDRLCLAGGREYLVVPRNDTTVELSLQYQATGTQAPVALANRLPRSRTGGLLAPRGPRPDVEFETRLRLRERRELGGRLAAARAAAGPRLSRSRAAPPKVGDRLVLNTSAKCNTASRRTGRVVAVGTHAAIVADTANPAGGLTDEHYRRIAAEFDNLVYPVDTLNFGAPTDIDQNQRVLIFYTRAVNELTKAGEDAYVGGFFWSGDLFPVAQCAQSNHAEIFYMLAADPAGEINGNKRDTTFVTRVTVGTLAHELEHLINSSRRLYVNNATAFEVPWLDEGLAHIAEELVFYRASGLGPRRNLSVSDLRSNAAALSAANRFILGNFGRLISYLEKPESNGPFQTDDDLATRGASWQFLRYAADRRNGDDRALWFSLVNSRVNGKENLRTALGVDPEDWATDWNVAVYTDDAVATLDTRYQQPSWNYRSVIAALENGLFPLRTRTIASTEPTTITLAGGGGAAYLRTGVAEGAVGEVQISAGGAGAAGLRVMLVRTK